MYGFLAEYIISDRKIYYTNLLHSLIEKLINNDLTVCLLNLNNLDLKSPEFYLVKEKKVIKGCFSQIKTLNVNYWGKEIPEYNNLRFSLLDNYQNFFSFLNFIQKEYETRVINDVKMMEYNLTKNYLLDFKEKLPFLPTKRINNYEELVHYSKQEKDFLVKPLISERSIGVSLLHKKLKESELKKYYDQYKSLEFIIQPYVDSFQKHGERKLCFLNGKFIFARKESSDKKIVHSDGGSKTTYYEPLEEEVELGKKVYKTFDKPFYFRLDLIRHNGVSVINEVELINPDWYFCGIEGKKAQEVLDRFNKEMLFSVKSSG